MFAVDIIWSFGRKDIGEIAYINFWKYKRFGWLFSVDWQKFSHTTWCYRDNHICRFVVNWYVLRSCDTQNLPLAFSLLYHVTTVPHLKDAFTWSAYDWGLMSVVWLSDIDQNRTTDSQSLWKIYLSYEGRLIWCRLRRSLQSILCSVLYRTTLLKSSAWLSSIPCRRSDMSYLKKAHTVQFVFWCNEIVKNSIFREIKNRKNLSLIWTRGSAMAEGPRDALVSRNSATTKHPIWKIESRAYGVALFAWSYVFFIQYRSVTDRQTHTQTNRRTDKHTTTACTALSIASRGKNRPYYLFIMKIVQKYTILHCPPSIITRQRKSVDSKSLGTPRNFGFYRIFER